MGFGKKLAGLFVQSNDDSPASTDAAPNMAEVDALMAELTADSAPSATATPPAANPTVVVDPNITEGSSFEEIYKEAGVPASPKIAEDLLKILDGMKGMDDATRRQFIAVLDQAEAHWEIKHPVADAEHKINALANVKAQLNQQTENAEAEAEKNAEAEDEYLIQAEAALREQITELEAQIETEKTEVQGRKEAIEKASSDKRAACTQEQIRLDSEVSRLRILPNTWGSHLNQPEAPTS